MAKGSQAPASKEDIRLLMEQIGRLYDSNERWKDEIIREVDGRIAASEARLKHHFDLAVETIRDDLLGAHKDRIEDHEARIVRLERQTGVRGSR
jgi:hypothetical protein